MPNEYCVLLLKTLACRHAASVKGAVELYMERRQMLMLATWLCTSISDFFILIFFLHHFYFFPIFFFFFTSNIFEHCSWEIFFCFNCLNVWFCFTLVRNSMYCTFICLGEHCLVRVVCFVPCLANCSLPWVLCTESGS